jgi:hypothetical protein
VQQGTQLRTEHKKKLQEGQDPLLERASTIQAEVVTERMKNLQEGQDTLLGKTYQCK